MKYFAMIDGRQCGPYELSELHDAGVMPDTYVWCKDMTDWQPASEVADICRYWRQRLAGTLPTTENEVPATQPPDPESTDPLKFSRFGGPGMPELPEPDTLFEPENPTVPPRTMLVPAIIATLACCPVTGFMAIYYAVLTRRCWTAAEYASTHPKEVPADTDVEELRRQAHDASRNARMWTGITFFLGLVLWAFLISRGT